MNIKMLLVYLIICGISPQAFADTPKRPNILIILADDCTYNDLPLYGGGEREDAEY